MLYTPAVNKALKISAHAHSEQHDKNGLPYIAHPLHLAEQMDTEAETCAALLHDVLEDSAITPSKLLASGIPAAAVNAIILLTRDEKTPYLDYVQAIANGDFRIAEPIASSNAGIERLIRSNDPARANHARSAHSDPIQEGIRIARKVKCADLVHNCELARLDLVTSRDLKRLEKYREARVILGDLVYKAQTPFGSFSVKVNGVPYAFHVELDPIDINSHKSARHSSSTIDDNVQTMVFQVDILPLKEHDKIEARYNFGGMLTGYDSDDTAVSTTFKKENATLTFSALTANKFDYTDQYPYQLVDRAGTYLITNDPIRYRYYPETHTIEYALAWSIS